MVHGTGDRRLARIRFRESKPIRFEPFIQGFLVRNKDIPDGLLDPNCHDMEAYGYLNAAVLALVGRPFCTPVGRRQD
jgi:hypothetical protein